MNDQKTCAHCRSVFPRAARLSTKQWEQVKYCSRLCHDEARRPALCKCTQCNVMFQPLINRKRGIKFCSIPCSVQYARLKPTNSRYKTKKVNGKKMLLHRAMMEEHLGRKLLTTEIVHHKDHDKSHNEISNFEIMTMSEHSRMHMTGNTHARR